MLAVLAAADGLAGVFVARRERRHKTLLLMGPSAGAREAAVEEAERVFQKVHSEKAASVERRPFDLRAERRRPRAAAATPRKTATNNTRAKSATPSAGGVQRRAGPPLRAE